LCPERDAPTFICAFPDPESAQSIALPDPLSDQLSIRSFLNLLARPFHVFAKAVSRSAASHRQQDARGESQGQQRSRHDFHGFHCDTPFVFLFLTIERPVSGGAAGAHA
jgi:hypothetical protein